MGYFDSTTFMGRHDPDDVFEFADGIVIWRTCCGENKVGQYERTTAGDWVWQFEANTRYHRTIKISPSLLWMTCDDADDPAQTWFLQRRLFPPKSDAPAFGKPKKGKTSSSS